MPGISGRRAQLLSLQKFLHCRRAVARGIDQCGGWAERVLDRARQQRIMGTAEHERINSLADERLEIARYYPIGQLIIQPTFFD